MKCKKCHQEIKPVSEINYKTGTIIIHNIPEIQLDKFRLELLGWKVKK